MCLASIIGFIVIFFGTLLLRSVHFAFIIVYPASVATILDYGGGRLLVELCEFLV